MNRLCGLLRVLLLLGGITLSFSSVASSTKDLPLSFEWVEPENSLYQQNCSSHSLLPCTLNLVVGSSTPVFLTITNNSTRTTALNIRAILPPALADIVQDASNCAQLLPSQQCQIAFTPGNTIHPATSVSVRGDNTLGYEIMIAVIPSSFTIGGSVSGLTAQVLVLQNNGIDNLLVPINSTNFQFATPIATGGSYKVTILTQPWGLSCTVANGTGSNLQANITNVTVTCAAPNYRVAFVPNYTNGTVSRCEIVQSTGLFSSNPACSQIYSGLSSSSDITINPAKTLAYIASNSFPGELAVCQIDNADLFVNCIGSGAFPNSKLVVFTALGAKAYVAGSTRVSLCNVSLNGALVGCALTGPTFTQISSMALNQAATTAYISDSQANQVYTCPVDPFPFNTIGNTCFTTSGFSSPQGVTLNPTGTFLYVTNNGTKNIQACPVALGGTLGACSIVATVPASIFSGFGKIAFNVAGTKAYIPYANNNPTTNLVYVCDADSVTGAFSNCANSTGTTFSGPAGLALY